MPGNMSFADLKKATKDGRIDTVVACFADMQGRLMGKRFHAAHFVSSAWEETHSCNYLLATDMEMETVAGFAATSWERGYGDYVMKPDLTTIRLAPWAEATAFVLCDLIDHHTHEAVPHSPRAILQAQVARLAAMGLSAKAATELEFFVYKESYDEAEAKGYRNLTPISPYNEDYHIFQTAKEEGLMRAIRNGLFGAGVPVENTKGEAAPGQAEVNIRYADAVDMADTHVFAKHAIKEIAFRAGRTVTFMAKPHMGVSGSSAHVHQSLWTDKGKPAFYDAEAPHGMSDTMKSWLAGLMKYAPDYTYFLAPYLNSYKRFARGTFAPTKIIWSLDNRTAGFRVVAEGTKAVRYECRIGGVDLNPYLALAALIAAGIKGIEGKLTLEPVFVGDAYAAQNAPDIPVTLHSAVETLRGSDMLRAAFSDEVVDHYVRAGEWEQEDFAHAVTDYEITRGFERS